MADGWIKLHRKVLDNSVVCKDSDHIAVWNFILLEAAYKSFKTWFGKELIELNPGQLVTGRKAIAKRFKIDESKVQRILKLFESEQLIEQRTSSTSRLISVICWEKYQTGEQQDEQPMNNDRTASEQPVNTIKEGNNSNKKKKTKNEIITPGVFPAFDDFWDLYDHKQDRPKCEKIWARLDHLTHLEIIAHVGLYVLATPDKKYRKHPKTYLNSQSWKNEIVNNNGSGKQTTSKNDRSEFNNTELELILQHGVGPKIG